MGKDKRGRMSNANKDFIARNADSMTIEEIAQHINKTPELVKNYIKNHLKFGDSFATETDRVKSELESKEIWPYVQKQFDEDELEFIKSEWKKIVAQFNFDVLPTEEIQILEVIQITVFLNRVKEHQFNYTKDLNELRKEKARLQMDLLDAEDDKEKTKIRGKISSCIEQMSFAESGANTKAKEYKDLLNDKTKILQSIKGTRDQRIAKIQSSKETFTDFIATLISEDEIRRQAGYEMERMREAAEIQKAKLADFHTYEDGQVDQPFLNADTVLD